MDALRELNRLQAKRERKARELGSILSAIQVAINEARDEGKRTREIAIASGLSNRQVRDQYY